MKHAFNIALLTFGVMVMPRVDAQAQPLSVSIIPHADSGTLVRKYQQSPFELEISGGSGDKTIEWLVDDAPGNYPSLEAGFFSAQMNGGPTSSMAGRYKVEVIVTDENNMSASDVVYFGVADDLYHQDFNNGNALTTQWTVVDEGRYYSSDWSIEDGEVVQSRNTFSPNSGSAYEGTNLVLTNETSDSPPDTWKNYSLSLDLRSEDDDAIGVWFYLKGENGYLFSMDSERSVRRLVKKEGDYYQVMYEENIGYLPGKTYRLDIFHGPHSVRIELDGIIIHSGSMDDATKEGTIALYSWANAGSYFDNLTVSPLRSYANSYNFIPSVYRPEVQMQQDANGYFATLSATADDLEEGDLSEYIQWYSSRDGYLGAGPAITTDYLSLGAHEITTFVFDNRGTLSRIHDTSVSTGLDTGSQLVFDEFDYELGSSAPTYIPWKIVQEGESDGPSEWRPFNGEMIEFSNTYTYSSGPEMLGTYVYYSETGSHSWTDYEFSIDITSEDNDSVGMMFRVTEHTDSYYRFSMDDQRKFWRLVKRVNGVTEVIYQQRRGYEQGRTYTVKATALGNQISIEVDGELFYVGTDNSIATGSVALYNWANVGTRFDNAIVNSLVE